MQIMTEALNIPSIYQFYNYFVPRKKVGEYVMKKKWQNFKLRFTYHMNHRRLTAVTKVS